MSNEELNAQPSESVTTEPETVESASGTDVDVTPAGEPVDLTGGVPDTGPQDEEAPPDGMRFEPVNRETLAQVGERLRLPVNVIADANPDVVSKETGEITADRLVVPE